MDREEKRRRLIVQAAGLVSALYAFLYTRIVLAQRSSRPAITYAPMSAMDEERQRNLDKISLDEEHYKGHIKAHPKDAELLNQPIENYQQMQVIFGNGLATGKFAMGSNEALGSPSDFSDGSIHYDSIKLDDVSKLLGEVATAAAGAGTGAGAAATAIAAAAAVGAKTGGGGAAATGAAGGSGVGNKRKRSMFSEEDVIVMTRMSSGLKDVADAIRETKALDSHPDLYDAVMFMPGFSEEALMAAYSHLLDNKAQGSGFVKMNDSHRVLWLRTWLTKHYFI